MIWIFWPFGVPIVIRWTPVFFSTERGFWDVKMEVALVLMGASTWLVPFQDEDSFNKMDMLSRYDYELNEIPR